MENENHKKESSKQRNLTPEELDLIKELKSEYGYDAWNNFFKLKRKYRYDARENFFKQSKIPRLNTPMVVGKIATIKDGIEKVEIEVKILAMNSLDVYDKESIVVWLRKENSTYKGYLKPDGKFPFEEGQMILGDVKRNEDIYISRMKPILLDSTNDRKLMGEDIEAAYKNKLSEEQQQYPLLNNIARYYNDNIETLKERKEKQEKEKADLQAKLNKLNEEVDKLKEQKEGQEKEKADLRRNYKNLLEEIKDTIKKIEEKKKLKEDKEKLENSLVITTEEVEDLEAELQKIEKKKEGYKSIIEKLNCLRMYGFGFLEKKEKENMKLKKKTKIKKNSITINEFVSMVEYKLRTEKFYYPERIVARFVEAMYTNQLIILYGPTGTGKTALPKEVSKAINGQCRTISVQSNWSDRQDLLGFYNVHEKRYISTPFLDALTEAAKDQETMYFVVLDEMNLAMVEYYFAEILSAMETEKKTLNLYSTSDCENARKRIVAKIERLFKNDKKEDIEKLLPKKQPKKDIDEIREEWKEKLEDDRLDAYYDLLEEWDNLNRYPAEFELPSNVQFVGTINMDASTKNISPKVIDRSYLIEIRETNEKKVLKITEELKDISENMAVSVSVFNSFRETRKAIFKENQGIIKEKLETAIKEIEDAYKGVSLRISKRCEKHIAKMFCGESVLLDSKKKKESQSGNNLQGLLGNRQEEDILENFLTDMILGKVLPTIMCEGNITTYNEKTFKNNKNIIKNEALSTLIDEKIDRMYIEEYKIFDYWR